jgi:hypothetical protein
MKKVARRAKRCHFASGIADMKKKSAARKPMAKAISWKDRLWIKVMFFQAKLNGFWLNLRGKFNGR